MKTVTEVIGNVYFCDFESDERKCARSPSKRNEPLRIAHREIGAAPNAAEEAERGRYRGTIDPEVA